MNRLLVGLSTLTLLLVSAPATAVHMSQAAAMCLGHLPEEFIQLLTDDINTANYRGPLCLKACKSQLAGCKKVSAALFKCENAAAKADWKTKSLKCQLDGIEEKKTCTDASKTELKLERDIWKSDFSSNKRICETKYQSCKAACAP